MSREREIRRGTHDQIDYIITSRRYRNMFTNAESYSKANIDTDHYPLIAKIRVRLRREKRGRKGRKNESSFMTHFLTLGA